jgi:Protein of unknown function (DUF2690)
MRKAVIPVIAFAVAAPMVLLANIPEAQAATSCYASTCTGKVAANTTCVSDGEVVEQTNISYAGSVIGYVQLKYSPSCRATWARIIQDVASTTAGGGAAATVKSTSTSIPLEGCNDSSGAAGTGCNTPMIDDLSPLTSIAEGTVPNIHGVAYPGTTSPPF